MNPKLLDLFCGAGGCSAGYAAAGFEVTGVDIHPQPRYPFEFHQADAMTFPLDGFDVIHASPPCQRFTRMNAKHFDKTQYPDMVEAVRDRLTGRPSVIENVMGSPLLRGSIVLCGLMFGLRLYRHRVFESSETLFGIPPHPKHRGGIVSVCGKGTRRYTRKANDKGGRINGPVNVADAQDAMGIDWMTLLELSQAIPPAYTEWIGRQLMPKKKERTK